MLDKKYLIVKDNNDKSITYFEYDNMDGYDLSPKKNVKIKDAINVNKVVVINPSLMTKVANKQLNVKFRKLLKFVTVIFDSDDESGTAYREGLNEISKLRLEAKVKYFKYMTEDEINTIEKKLDILEHELKLRLFYLAEAYSNLYNYEDELDNCLEGKSR